MSQTTETQIQNQNGLSFRTKLNQMLSALNTVFAGTTAPTATEANMLWMDTSVTPNVLKRRNSSDTAWEIVPLVESATLAAASKATPVDADLIPLVDSDASFGLKKLTWANLKASLNTYFDTLYQAAGNYLTTAGGTMTGDITLNNSVNIRGKDTGGTARIILQMSADSPNNFVNIVNGAGSKVRILNQTMAAELFTCDNAGNVVIAGSLSVAGATPTRIAQYTASLSGASYDFTGLPSWAKEVAVSFNSVTTGSNSVIQLQFGTSGGFVTSGYAGSASVAFNNQAPAITTMSSGFLTTSVTAAGFSYRGTLHYELMGTGVWVGGGVLGQDDSARINQSAGAVGVSGTLDRIRVTTIGGVTALSGSVTITVKG